MQVLRPCFLRQKGGSVVLKCLDLGYRQNLDCWQHSSVYRLRFPISRRKSISSPSARSFKAFSIDTQLSLSYAFIAQERTPITNPVYTERTCPAYRQWPRKGRVGINVTCSQVKSTRCRTPSALIW